MATATVALLGKVHNIVGAHTTASAGTGRDQGDLDRDMARA